MDWTAIATTIVGAILGIGGVGLAVSSFLGKYSKYVMLAKDAVETLADVVSALKDGTLSADEVAKIIYVLCTETSSYVNGAEIHINGGQHV
jgi:NAD(P)-dependent dehydrogenase (short-subunit alcohol dehydrogenase family)